MNKLIGLFLVLLFNFNVSASRFPKREMRAVWIATVANIDWPSATNLTTAQQQKELLELLDLCKTYNMNTVVFQIRPAADAFYASRFEPWSQWLTGTQGKQPNPLYDPLTFAVTECHKRGLELHVWINPYRAVFNTTNSSIAPDHITKVHPEWFVNYGTTKYFNPALAETRNFVASVVSDIVRRYDIDAIHMDDYFYPYRIAGVDFPDEQSFKNNPQGFKADQRDDWRRHNVDLIIKQLHDSIKAIKPWVELGISPFGVWRNIAKDPNGSKTKAGQTNYDDLFADVLKWEREKWIDYITPQIYWERGKEVADYSIIAEWWSRNNFDTQLYIGQALYRIDPNAKEKAWQSADEIIEQIKFNRKYHEIAGSMFFSAKFLRVNPLKLKEKLLKKYYRYPALVPENKRITTIEPSTPTNQKITIENGELHFSWTCSDNNKSYVIYKYRNHQKVNIDQARHIFLTTSDNSVTYLLDKQIDPRKYKYAVSAISRSNLESKPVIFSE